MRRNNRLRTPVCLFLPLCILVGCTPGAPPPLQRTARPVAAPAGENLSGVGQATPAVTTTATVAATPTVAPTETPVAARATPVEATATPVEMPVKAEAAVTARVEEARADLRHNRFQQAEEKYRAALGSNPNDVAALAGLSEAYRWLDSGRKRAVETAHRAAGLEPKNPLAAAALAQALADAESGDEAVKAAEQAQKLEPESPEVYAALMSAYFAGGRIALARDTAAKALAAHQSDPLVLTAAAGVYGKTGDHLLARALVERAIELEPEFAPWHDALCRLAAASGHVADAERSCRRAIELAPDWARPMVSLASLSVQQGKLILAEDWYQLALKAQPESVSVQLMGVEIASAGDRQSVARSQIQRLQLSAPDDYRVRVAWGDHLLDSGQCETAADYAQEISRAHPRASRPQLQLADALLCTGEIEDAARAAQRAVELQPFSFEALQWSGVLHIEKEEYDDAQDALVSALTLAPNPRLAHVLLGDALLSRMDVNAAAQEYRRALAMDGAPEAAQGGLCQALLFDGQTETALPECQKAAAALPHEPIVQRNYGLALLLRGDAKRAIEVLEANEGYDVLSDAFLGAAYVKTGRYKDAIGVYEACQKQLRTENAQITRILSALKETYEMDTAAAEKAIGSAIERALGTKVKIETGPGVDGKRTMEIIYRMSATQQVSQLTTPFGALLGIAITYGSRVRPPLDGGARIRVLDAKGESILDLRSPLEAMWNASLGLIDTQGVFRTLVPDPSAGPSEGVTDAQAAAIGGQVAEVRGLRASRDVKFERKSPAELRALMEEMEDAEAREASVSNERLLKLLGLIPAGFDLIDTVRDVGEEQILGMYDFEKEVFYLATGKAPTAVDKMTIAHEYVHALQDQALAPVPKKNAGPEPSGDARMAVQALIEGDALLAMQQFGAKHLPLQAQIESMGPASIGGSRKEMGGAPEFLREAIVFPYTAGAEFVSQLYSRGKWSEVDRAYSRLPESTEQVLHPEKYRAQEHPVAVDLPDLAAALGDGWAERDRDVMGELGWRLTLLPFAGPSLAGWAADGWAGDRYSYLESATGGQAVVFENVWDTSGQARDFTAAVKATMDRRAFREVIVDAGGPARRFEGDSTYWDLRVSGKNVTLVVSNRPEVGAKLLSAVPVR